MTQDDLQQAVQRQPFQPIRLHLSNGAVYDIRHPDLIMVGKRSAAIGQTMDPHGTVYDRLTQVDLLHIVRIEELPAAPLVIRERNELNLNWRRQPKLVHHVQSK